MKRLLILSVLLSSLGWGVAAQDQPSDSEPTPTWDARQFVRKYHVHQIAGVSTLTLAALTGAAGITLATGNGWSGLEDTHGALGKSAVIAGAATLALGLTAYSDRLDEVWPHALLMGVAETGFLLNAFVLEPGSPPHRATGVISVTSLFAGLVAIIVIKNNERNP